MGPSLKEYFLYIEILVEKEASHNIKFVGHLFLFWDRVSGNQVDSQIYYVLKAVLKLLILMPPSPKGWIYWHGTWHRSWFSNDLDLDYFIIDTMWRG